MKKKTKIFWIFGIIFLLIITLFLLKPQLTSFVLKSKGIIQYVVLEEQWTKTHPYPIIKSATARIGDYIITTEFSDVVFTKVCYQPPNNANFTFVDDDGCQHWNNPQTKVYQKCNCMGCFEWDSRTDYSKAIGCGADSFRGRPIGCQTWSCTNYDWTIDNEGGGIKDVFSTYGCFNQVTITKNEKKVYEHNMTLKQQNSVFFDDLSISLGASSNCKHYGGTSYGFTTFLNQYEYKPVKEGDVSFIIVSATSIKGIKDVMNASLVGVKGKALYINTKIINKKSIPLKAKLDVSFEIPTIIGSAKKVESQIIDLPVGESNVLFVFNDTSRVTDELRITPIIIVLYPTSYLSGVNVPNPVDGKLIQFDQLEFLEVSIFEGDTVIVSISSEKEIVEINQTIIEHGIPIVIYKIPLWAWIIISVLLIVLLALLVRAWQKKK